MRQYLGYYPRGKDGPDTARALKRAAHRAAPLSHRCPWLPLLLIAASMDKKTTRLVVGFALSSLQFGAAGVLGHTKWRTMGIARLGTILSIVWLTRRPSPMALGCYSSSLDMGAHALIHGSSHWSRNVAVGGHWQLTLPCTKRLGPARLLSHSWIGPMDGMQPVDGLGTARLVHWALLPSNAQAWGSLV